MFGHIKHIHFVGLGGIGISGMAELLFKLGFKISGSDTNPSEITAHLLNMGITFYEGHAADHISGCDLLVYSSAVKQDNPELIAAREGHIPVIRRAEMLGELLKVGHTSVAVAGTHGKTTTSSMIGTMLASAQRDPTMIIGGIVKSLATNMRQGKGDIIVVEADEFDRTFLSLKPTVAVVNNIEMEHTDSYASLEDLQGAFVQFANAVPFYGRVIACLDEPNVQALLPQILRPVTTYGLAPQADIRATKLDPKETRTQFDLLVPEAGPVRVDLPVPGSHNVVNALAAVATGLELEVPLDEIVAGIARFTGVSRRFEITDELDDVLFVDDYAHHPTEVSAVLKAARGGWDRRLVAVFQPHLYSRTRDFHEDFARAFLDSNVLVVTDVYPAREEAIKGVDGNLIVDGARKFGHKQAHYVADKNQLPEILKDLILPGDMVITMGAGDITRYNRLIREGYAG